MANFWGIWSKNQNYNRKIYFWTPQPIEDCTQVPKICIKKSLKEFSVDLFTVYFTVYFKKQGVLWFNYEKVLQIDNHTITQNNVIEYKNYSFQLCVYLWSES